MTAGDADLISARTCALHGYTEKSGRDKMRRHRARGDDSVSMLWHAGCKQWHVENFAEVAAVPTRPCPDCKGRGCHYDRHWQRGGSPGVCFTCNSTGYLIQPQPEGTP